MDNITLSIEDYPNQEDLNVISRGLVEHTEVYVSPRNFKTLAVLLRENNKRVVGGLYASTAWEWLHINQLWVANTYRKCGYGAQLLKSAEQAAKVRKCKQAYLDTFDFQALSFYQKYGYKIFGVIDNFVMEHKRYFLKKTSI